MTVAYEIVDIEQGSPEWHALRKTKITATDANVIMGASPWKTPLQLYHEKLSNDPPTPPNERQQRGLDLEPIARELFCLEMDRTYKPAVIVYDWAMASLDGMDFYANHILEIKCPGDKDHALAIAGKVPNHYYPQLQHQMYVAGASFVYYFSFDGVEGVIVQIDRDEEYIKKMLDEEKKFYDRLINKTPPEAQERDYQERSDPLWERCALRWRLIQEEKKLLEKEEEDLRNQIIFLAGGSNTKGSGLSLSQYQRKGTVDYSTIPELNNLDLEQYRKPSTTSWRITCQ